MNQPMRLIEVDRFRDIGGNHGIVLPELGDAINLHGQQDRNAVSLQIARQQHGSRSAPAMAEEHDVGMSLFGFGESPVAIEVEQMHDRFEGVPAVTVFEDLYVRVRGKTTLYALGELHGAMMRIVVADESAHESDHDTGGRGGLGADGRRSLSSSDDGCRADQTCEGEGAR